MSKREVEFSSEGEALQKTSQVLTHRLSFCPLSFAALLSELSLAALSMAGENYRKERRNALRSHQLQLS